MYKKWSPKTWKARRGELMNLKILKHNGYLWTYIVAEDKRYLKIVPFTKVKEETAQELLDML